MRCALSENKKKEKKRKRKKEKKEKKKRLYLTQEPKTLYHGQTTRLLQTCITDAVTALSTM